MRLIGLAVILALGLTLAPLIRRWLSKRQRFHLNFTPTGAETGRQDKQRDGGRV